MAYDSLQKQFKALLRRNQGKVDKTLVKVMDAMSYDWVNEMVDHSYGWQDVTGNTITGYFVGAYLCVNGKMKLISAAFSRDRFEEPTRLWLKDEEKYDLPYYYGGMPVDPDHPFTGFIGERNADSYKEAVRFLRSHAPKKAPVAFLVGVATDYASYLQTRENTDLIGAFCENRKNKGWIVKMYGVD